ncbi:hypothetical protein OCU04_004539 [Sclerotinia nivalis]|uniref:DUF7779 domain-containing protein n=1 Tax=Sclerotinia nivalis TaxID=352851 RepID=A0A9X0DMI6_9HELO|nr:hypothetical protein OCU04_004539 [Sclerotinia nivalis]
MAGLIHRRDWSISEFMEMYNRQLQKMHGVSGNGSINALWNISFNSLDPQKDEIGLPESLKFCAGNLSFWNAIDDLLSRALIKRDRDTKTLSLHRLVQTSYKYFMTFEQREQSFSDAVSLLHLAFPRHDAVAQLYQKWNRCMELLPHILTLKDNFREEIATARAFKAPPFFCELNNLCERYLLETNSLPSSDKTNDMLSSVTSYKGQLLVRIGKASEGVDIQKRSYEIRTEGVPENPREVAWASENAGNAIATTNQFSESIIWLERAIDIWLRWAKTQSQEKDVYPAVLKKSYGTVLLWMGCGEKARTILEEGLRQIESTEPYSWAMAAYTHFALGTLDRQDRNYITSEAHFMEAQNMWTFGDQLRTDPFNASCMYRMGCVALDQGNLEAAINSPAEHARCVFKLSEALHQEPRYESEASRLRMHAERLLCEINPEAAEFGDELAYDSPVNMHGANLEPNVDNREKIQYLCGVTSIVQ